MNQFSAVVLVTCPCGATASVVAPLEQPISSGDDDEQFSYDDRLVVRASQVPMPVGWSESTERFDPKWLCPRCSGGEG